MLQNGSYEAKPEICFISIPIFSSTIFFDYILHSELNPREALKTLEDVSTASLRGKGSMTS